MFDVLLLLFCFQGQLELRLSRWRCQMDPGLNCSVLLAISHLWILVFQESKTTGLRQINQLDFEIIIEQRTES